MSESPTSAPSRSAPWGVLGMLALVFLVEHLAIRDITSPISTCWSHAAHRGLRNARGCGIVCFGDSMVKHGVVPRVLAGRTGRPTYNLALHAGMAPSSYYLLAHALEAGARPSAIVVDFAPHLVREDPANPLFIALWSNLLSLPEHAALAWRARDSSFFAAMMMTRVLDSYKNRYEIRGNVLTALKGGYVGERELAQLFLRNWNRNDGAQITPENPGFQDVPPPSPAIPAGSGTWHCHPLQALYLEKFLDLAQRRGIPVYWVLPPVSPNSLATDEHNGDEARILAFVRRIQARHPGLTVIDGQHSGYDRTVFHDPYHMSRRGAVAFSEGVADVLLDRQPAGTSRWVTLPAYHEGPANIPLEDFNQSRIALETLKASVKR